MSKFCKLGVSEADGQQTTPMSDASANRRFAQARRISAAHFATEAEPGQTWALSGFRD